MSTKIAVSTAFVFAVVAVAAAPSAFAEKRGSSSGAESDAVVNKQLEWENKVVGPKKGLDKDHLAAIQEQGRREEAARKKEPPKKAERPQGIDAPGGATMPTMDIEKPAAATTKKSPKKVASAQPKQKDALDNLLEEQGVKPNGGTGNAALNSVVASTDKGGGSSDGSASRKTKRPHRR